SKWNLGEFFHCTVCGGPVVHLAVLSGSLDSGSGRITPRCSRQAAHNEGSRLQSLPARLAAEREAVRRTPGTMSPSILSQRTLQYVLDLLRGPVVLGLFAIGFALAAAGLIASVNAPFSDPGVPPILHIALITVLALGLLLCGWVLTSFTISFVRSHARIV